jgi:hypothetical protein
MDVMRIWNRSLAPVIVVVALTQSAVRGESQTQSPAPAAPAAAAPSTWTFAAGAGMVFFQVKAAQAPAFEAAMLRLKAALAASKDPVRKRQAQSWQVLKSTEPSAADGPIVYIFYLPVAVENADYDPLKILTEQFPAEAQSVYETISSASTSINRLGLKKIADMGSNGGPG